MSKDHVAGLAIQIPEDMSLEEKRQRSFRRARSKVLARYRTEHGSVVGRLRRHGGEDGFEATTKVEA